LSDDHSAPTGADEADQADQADQSDQADERTIRNEISGTVTGSALQVGVMRGNILIRKANMP
jgi:hypothetical protein